MAARLVVCLVVMSACTSRGPRCAGAGDDALSAAVRAGEFPDTSGVVAYQHGELVYERYFGDASADTRIDVRSVTKSITALAIGIAIADRAIPSVKAPAFAYLSDLGPFAHDGAEKASITIEDLLTMSSRLDCDDEDPSTPGNEENMYPQPRWARWAVDLPLRTGVSRDGNGRYSYAYCTAGVFLLGQILERTTGMPVDRYIERRLLAPLGLHAVVWFRSPTGEVATGGQLRIRTRDLAKVAQLILARGRLGEAQIVPAAWIDQMLVPRLKLNKRSDPAGIHQYGYLMWRREYTTPCGTVEGWYMSGNGGNHAVVLRDLGAVAVVTRTHYSSRGMHDQTAKLLETHIFPRLRCS